MAAKIFILDDSPSILEMTAAVLRLAGYEVEVASDAQQMVSCLQTFRPDLLLLDVMMPEGFGYELIDYCREALRISAPVVLFSSVNERTLQELTARYHADGYISKDRDFSTIPSAVEPYLASQRR